MVTRISAFDDLSCQLRPMTTTRSPPLEWSLPLDFVNAKVLALVWLVETADLVHEPCNASLNSLDHVDVSLMVRSPGRDIELKVRADVRGVERQPDRGAPRDEGAPQEAEHLHRFGGRAHSLLMRLEVRADHDAEVSLQA